MLGTPHKFARHGKSGGWFSDIIPHMAGIADDICVIKSMWTNQFNHAPAELFLFTGNQNAGAASMGSWITYGLGSENQDLPGFVVLLSGGTDPTGGKSLWGSGFLPGVYQGVQCRSAGDPVLFLSNPPGIDGHLRRQVVSTVNKINQREYEEIGDPETMTRISQYEMAYRMQMAASDAMDIKQESQAIVLSNRAQHSQTLTLCTGRGNLGFYINITAFVINKDDFYARFAHCKIH